MLHLLPLATALLASAPAEIGASADQSSEHVTPSASAPAPEGGFGLKWGTSSATVRAEYPKGEPLLQGVIASEEFFTVEDVVEDMRVEVKFSFYNDRLYEVVLSSLVTGDIVRRVQRGEPPPTADDQKRRLLAARVWRNRLLPILISKYGRPEQEPSAASRRKYCDEGPYECGLFLPGADRELVWGWRVGGTDIVLNGGPADELTYADRRTEERVRAIKVAQKDASRRALEEKRRQQRERL